MKSRRAALAALATVMCGAAVLVLSNTTASAAVQDHPQILTLTLRYADAADHFIGKDADHPAIGDEFIDTAPVRTDGKVVGQATNICTIVSGTTEATFVTQCAGTFTLARGKLINAGADDSSDKTTDAVTGGTGAFTYASGTATTVSGTDAATVTIRYATSR
jgi:hypothetical protein